MIKLCHDRDCAFKCALSLSLVRSFLLSVSPSSIRTPLSLPMASSTLAIPTSYHRPTPAIRTSKLTAAHVRSEDELLKFFLHGSYDVQRGHTKSVPVVDESRDRTVCLPESKPILTVDAKTGKSRCMFEETYMINISVKQPDTRPTSKQIDVRIEKTPSDNQIENNSDDDEISSIFDEDDDEDDDIDSVILNDTNASVSETPPTKLTLADMINKTLTTISSTSPETTNSTWPADNESAVKVRKTSEATAPVETPAVSTTITEDEKLFEYLDYLETKEESSMSTRVIHTDLSILATLSLLLPRHPIPSPRYHPLQVRPNPRRSTPYPSSISNSSVAR